jgi:hypothetical protein
MTVGEWAQIAGVAGTFAAVIVALFGPKLLPPRLKLTIDESTRCEVRGTKWCHLQVTNRRRWSPVTAVRVFLLQIEVPGRPDKSWIGRAPFRWRFAERPDETRDLGPDTDCDLCAISRAGILKLQPANPRGVPDVSYKPPCHLKLIFQARGLEGDSRKLNVDLNWEKKDEALDLTWADGGK